MNESETRRISSISQVISSLLDGGTPQPIKLTGQENDQLQHLALLTNRLASEIQATTKATDGLASGTIDIPVESSISFATSLKTLQSILQRLTWQTSQIAGGVKLNLFQWK